MATNFRRTVYKAPYLSAVLTSKGENQTDLAEGCFRLPIAEQTKFDEANVNSVACSSLMLTNNIQNYDSEEHFMVSQSIDFFKRWPGKFHIDQVEEFIDAVGGVDQKIMFYDRKLNRVMLKLEEGQKIFFSKKLSLVLGFDQQDFEGPFEKAAIRAPDLYYHYRFMIVMADICQHSIVGSKTMPVLGVLNTSTLKPHDNDSSALQIDFEAPYFVGTLANPNPYINVSFLSDTLNPVSFDDSAQLSIKLIFRTCAFNVL